MGAYRVTANGLAHCDKRGVPTTADHRSNEAHPTKTAMILAPIIRESRRLAM
jgi:hypothetical protein